MVLVSEEHSNWELKNTCIIELRGNYSFYMLQDVEQKMLLCSEHHLFSYLNTFSKLIKFLTFFFTPEVYHRKAKNIKYTS